MNKPVSPTACHMLSVLFPNTTNVEVRSSTNNIQSIGIIPQQIRITCQDKVQGVRIIVVICITSAGYSVWEYA